MHLQFSCISGAVLVLAAGPAFAGDAPYFVTYSHDMEEPGSLELAIHQVAGSPVGGNAFVASLMEIEYGLKTWWTTEFYLSGQTTRGESTVFTGYRWENRFRPLLREHWINPVLYVEFANLNGADKTLREVVGHDVAADLLEPNSETRLEHKREIETKLILSSNFRGWNVSENLIAEKNLANEPWEFGYAFGVSRPLRLEASAAPCRWCRENFRAGVEMFGGLGTLHEFGLRETSHYIAPGLSWRAPGGALVSFSPAFGLNADSARVLLRLTLAYEMSDVARVFRRSAQ